MSAPHRTSLLECPHCGLVQHAGTSLARHIRVCARCEGRLPGGLGMTRVLPVVCASLAALLLLLAFSEPVFEMHLAGRYAVADVLTGPRMLDEYGMPELSLIVILTLLVAPVAHLGILALGLIGSRLPNPPRWLFMPLGMLEETRLWSMPDVFLLASVVCYGRLHAWANIKVGTSLLSMIALVLVMIAAEVALDPHSLWEHMPWHRPEAKDLPSHPSTRLSCHWCRLVNDADEGESCARCGRTLHRRKHRSMPRTGALLVTAVCLCVPANVLPVMDMIQFGRNDSNTIYSGVVELAHHDLWGLAILIFCASIIIPAVKIVAMALLLIQTKRGRATHLRARTRTFTVVRLIGRWSLVDVYAVTILVSLVHMGRLASVLPRYGAVAFCGVVIMTMIAAETFDPRLMWDAAGFNGTRFHGPHKPERST